MNANILCKYCHCQLAQDAGSSILHAGAVKPSEWDQRFVELPDPNLIITKQTPEIIDFATQLME